MTSFAPAVARLLVAADDAGRTLPFVGVGGRLARDLAVPIRDPNRDVPPDGVGFVVGMKLGQVHSGRLVEEAADRIVQRVAGGTEEILARTDFEAIRTTGRSLMLEGFEQTLSERDLADVIAFLRAPPLGKR